LSRFHYIEVIMNLSNHYLPITTGCRLAAVAIRAAAFALLLGAALPLAAQTAGPSKTVQTFLVYYGGGPSLVASDAQKLAKFDLIDVDRFRYNELAPTTWAAVKALNPNIGIYLYELGPETPNYQDTWAQAALNGLGRYNVSRGHPQGSLNGNNPGLFLLDAAGSRVYSAAFSNVSANQFWYLMDFGNPAYQSYWVEAVRADIATQPWAADGVHADNCLVMASGGGYSATPSKYPTDAAWSDAMNTFVNAISAGLHGYGQKLWCNRGATDQSAGAASWLALDAGPNPPDVVAEEGAFAVMWGTNATRFYPEANWKSQVDVLSQIQRSKVAIFSHTVLAEGQSGTDNWGKPVTFVQSLWYALGSYLLGKNDVLNNAYFAFTSQTNYNNIQWYNEYDKIDLGKAIGAYTVTTIGSVNVYRREFEKGYVYVNPTATDVASVTLPQALRQLTRANLLSPLDSIPSVTSITLNGHNAAILLKTVVVPVVDTVAPSTPTGLLASAVSSSQINLSWAASTDNVGVTGYRVYRAGTLLATLGAVTTYQNTGLSASTSYSYTVQAVDAAGNASAQSASASATTQAAPDTIAPSVPTGLTGTAVSATQINLTWNASTDNVAVTGYQVYLNDALLASTTLTSFQQTGLTAGTTYNYRVSAADAVPNYSAWTATPVSVTTPAAPDTTAPSTPAGLLASAVSASQINLSWAASTDNVGVTGYRVYRAGTLLVTLGAVTSYQNTGLSASTSYSYTVQAIDAAGNASAQSASASATTQAAPDTTAPSTPAGLLASAVSASQINLSWAASTDNVGVTGYRVYRAGILLVTLGAVTSYQNTGLSASTSYSYTVQAIDAAGNASAQSNSASATTQAAPDTQAPSVPTGLKGTAVSPTQINLTWNASTDNVGVKGYYVYLNDVALATTTSTSFQHTGLTAGTTYNYRVSAYDAVPNNSAWTATPVSVRTTRRRIIGSDFNGDGKSDILWRNSTTGQNAIWLMNGATLSSGAPIPTVTDLNWSIAGVGDFDGNGKSDILWRNSATGQDAIWLMNGTTLSVSGPLPTEGDLNWSIAGVGDFDGNGKSDILWRHRVTGENAIWLVNGTTLSGGWLIPTEADLNWSIAGVGDFDGDGKSDILWRHRVTGANAIWLMNGVTLSGSALTPAVTDLNWSIAGVGDFDGDGKSDVLWRNGTTGENTIWLMNGTTLSASIQIAAQGDLNWSIAGVGDFDGDGKPDILWRNSTTGQDAIWLMNGTTLSSSVSINTRGAGWSIAPR
jgi:chitodextrinase